MPLPPRRLLPPSPGSEALGCPQLWQSSEQVTLLVAAPEVEEQCRQLGMPLAAPLAEGWALPTRPRCLHLEKGPQGFGFLLREEKGLGGRLGEWEPAGLGVDGVCAPISQGCPCLRPGPDLVLGPPPSLCAWLTWGARGGAASMSVSQGSSCGRWTQGCRPTKLGCGLGTGWWLWPGRAWRGWATRRRCPGSELRAPAWPSPSWTPRLTASSEWCVGRRGRGGGAPRREQLVCPLRLLQVRLSPLLFLESAEAPASPQSTRSAPGTETQDPAGEDTALPPAPRGSRRCCLYPGPGGGYGFRLSYVASGPRLSISQVTGAHGPSLLVDLAPLPPRP